MRLPARGHGRPFPLTTVAIQEDVRSGAPLRVDRDAGIIYGVKVLGLDSQNGRRYTKDAIQLGRPLYEGILVNIDHLNDDSDERRSSYDRIGKLVNVQVTEDGLRADLHLLRTHPMTKRLLEAAESMPEAFGLSHDAQGDGEEDSEGIFVVHEITEVRHVDVVADPATTRSLNESKESNVDKDKDKELGLDEDDDLGFGTDTDTATEEPGEMGWNEHMAEMMRAIMNDGELSNDDKRAKVLKALGLLDSEAAMEDDEDVEEDDEEEEDVEEDDKDKDEKDKLEEDDEEDDKKKKMEESIRISRKLMRDPNVRKLVEQNTVYRARRRRRLLLCEAKKLCRAAKLPREVVTRKLIETIATLPDKTSRRHLVESILTATKARKPRSLGLGGNGAGSLPEDADAKTFSKALKAI